jgi:hypothetical protein
MRVQSRDILHRIKIWFLDSVDLIHTRLDHIHAQLDLIHTLLDIIYTLLSQSHWLDFYHTWLYLNIFCFLFVLFFLSPCPFFSLIFLFFSFFGSFLLFILLVIPISSFFLSFSSHYPPPTFPSVFFSFHISSLIVSFCLHFLLFLFSFPDSSAL